MVFGASGYSFFFPWHAAILNKHYVVRMAVGRWRPENSTGLGVVCIGRIEFCQFTSQECRSMKVPDAFASANSYRGNFIHLFIATKLLKSR